MAFRTQKISQMTPKGANLEATDLIEVSTIESGSYVTRSITGQEIIDGIPPAAAAWGSITGTLSSQTDLQTALNAKQDTLVSGTNIKTLEGQSLLGSGNIDLTKSDVGLANVDNTSDLNKPISTATQTALNAKQDTITLTTTGTSGAATLVGSTLNIPQYSGGSSSITIGTTAITSGTVGRILFEGTGNVVQESGNLFWDNTNGRLGIGTSTPTRTLSVVGSATSGFDAISFKGQYSKVGYLATDNASVYLASGANVGESYIGLTATALTLQAASAFIDFRVGASRGVIFSTGNWFIGPSATDAGFRLDVNGTARVSGNLTLTGGSLLMNNNNIYIARGTGGASDGMEIRALSSGTDAVKVTTSSVSISSSGGITYQASAQLAVDSTTRGFLPPRMTTTQKNAIASPAAGLVVYDTTLAKLCVYTTTWETITSI